jgi:hypothetical protein
LICLFDDGRTVFESGAFRIFKASRSKQERDFFDILAGTKILSLC